MGIYIPESDVKTRLIGKVQFVECDDDPNKLGPKLLRQLITEAEGDVELDLSPRFAAPFQTVDGLAFDKLPDHPTKAILRALCLHKAVIKVLETDFGKGSAVNGDKYIMRLEARYNNILNRIMARKEPEGSGWKFPPLTSLRLNYFNTTADDGFNGQILNTSHQGRSGSFPQDQINDPSENFFSLHDREWDR